MGAATTLGASLFLWMCVITFFTKFAVIMSGASPRPRPRPRHAFCVGTPTHEPGVFADLPSAFPHPPFSPRARTLAAGAGTILLSLLYALFFFIPLCAALGPEGDTADIVAMARKCMGKSKANKVGKP